MLAFQRSHSPTLHLAAARGCKTCFNTLLASCQLLSTNSAMDNTVTPVYLATQEGHLHVLRYLVEEASDSTHLRTKDSVAPIHAAAQMSSLACLQWMVENQGLDSSITEQDKTTPTYIAASRGEPHALHWLLGHGAKFKSDKYGRLAIHDTSDHQNVEVTNKTTSINFDGQERLNKMSGVHHWPSEQNKLGLLLQPIEHNECLAILLQHGNESDEFEHSCSISEVAVKMKNNCPCSHSDNSATAACFTSFSAEANVEYAHKPTSGIQLNNSPPFYLHSPIPLRPGAEHGRSSSDPGPSSKPFFLHDPGRERNCDRLRLFFRDGLNSVPTVVSESQIVTDRNHSQSRESASAENNELKSPLSCGMSPDSLSLPFRSAAACEAHSLPLEIRAPNVLGRQASLPPPPPPLPMEDNKNSRTHLQVLQRHASMPTMPSQTENDLSNIDELDYVDNTLTDVPINKHALPHQDDKLTDCNFSSVHSAQKTTQQLLVHRQMSVPFIPPKFPTASSDSDCLIKPSEYLRAVAGTKNNDSSCSNNDQDLLTSLPSVVSSTPVPTMVSGAVASTSGPMVLLNGPVTLQELQKVQLKKTDGIAKKQSTASHNIADVAILSKDELIAELKMSKDIQGVRKLKEERAKIEEEKEKRQEDELNRHFTASNFVDQIPEVDANGIPIPPWKRQMLAKRAAEKAKKDAEEQRVKDAEEKRMNTIPLWKRQLMHKKEPECSQIPSKKERP